MKTTNATPPAGNDADAFTLVELLVVMAIVAVLASMLLPVLAGAKGRAQSVQCLGNLRQLQVAWQLYADDHDGRLAPNWYFEAVETNPGRFQSWARGVMSFEANRPDNTNTAYLTQGLLGRYASSAGVFRCPSDRSVARIGGQLLLRVRTAAMNHWMGFEDESWDQGQCRFLRLSDLLAPPPSLAFVLTMQREDAIEDAWMRIDPEGGGGIVQWPEAYHHRSANFSFADGHAQGHRWQGARTTPPLRRGSRLAEWGFPLAGNPDARWIRDHATSRARK